MSDDAPKPVHEALAAAAMALGPIPKADRNKQQGFSYRGIETILAKAGPIMAARGIVWLPQVEERTVETILVGKQEKPWRLVSLRVRYRIIGPAGDSVEVVSTGEGSDPGDKASNKAMSAAFKYALLQVLQIAEGHDDGDSEGLPDEPSGQRRRGEGGPAAAPRRQRPQGQSRPAPAHTERPANVDENGEVQAAEPAEAQPDVTPSGDDGDPRRDLIGQGFDAIESETWRKEAKEQFMGEFGQPPATLPVDRLDAALDFVQKLAEQEPF